MKKCVFSTIFASNTLFMALFMKITLFMKIFSLQRFRTHATWQNILKNIECTLTNYKHKLNTSSRN